MRNKIIILFLQRVIRDIIMDLWGVNEAIIHILLDLDHIYEYIPHNLIST